MPLRTVRGLKDRQDRARAAIKQYATRSQDGHYMSVLWAFLFYTKIGIRDNMQKIISKYKELNKICKQYPAIELSDIENKNKYLQQHIQSSENCKPGKYTRNGFVEQFIYNKK